MSIKSTSIKGKFSIIIMIILSLLGVFTVFIVLMIGRIADYSSSIITHPMQVSNEAYHANIEMMRMKKYLTDILLAEEDYEINTYIDQIRVSEAKVYNSLNIVGNHILGEEGEALHEEAKKLFDEWKPIRNEIISAVRLGDAKKALEITQYKEEVHSQELERKLVDLNQYARVKANAFETEVNELEQKTINMIVLGVVFFAFVSLTSIIWVGINVVEGIGNLRKQLEKVIDGSDVNEVEIVGINELRQLSSVFNTLFQSLQQQIWLKEGNQRLYNILSEKGDYHQILNEYCREIVDYANLIACGFYEFKEDKLNLISIENNISLFKATYQLGEGLVGECAQKQEGKRIEVAECAGMYKMDIPFGFINVLPVKHDRELLGVVMLVASKKPSVRVVEYIGLGVKELSTYVEREQQRELLNENSVELTTQNKELNQLRERLEVKYKDLEESTKYRTQFIANVSHELRTPLNSIIILSDILTNRTSGEYEAEDTEKIEVINLAAKELLKIINSILDLARAESNKSEVENEVFSSGDLMNSWKVMFEPMINEKDLIARFEMEVDYIFRGDESKVYHIVSNLLANAIKFTSMGEISVSLRVTKGEAFPIVISVSDTGIGIKKEKMEAVFEEFVQSDGSINRNFGGTGLGLAICRSYAELIGGVIEVESEYGIGSNFKLLLPDTYLMVDEYYEKEILDISSSHNELLELGVDVEGMVALVCDDEPFNIFALSSILEHFGITTVGALNYSEALSAYEDTEVDIIFMDLMLPQKDGFEILNALKKLPKWRNVPIIMVTAANLTGKQLYDIERKGYRLLRKPIITKDLNDLLRDQFNDL